MENNNIYYSKKILDCVLNNIGFDDNFQIVLIHISNAFEILKLINTSCENNKMNYKKIINLAVKNHFQNVIIVEVNKSFEITELGTSIYKVHQLQKAFDFLEITLFDFIKMNVADSYSCRDNKVLLKF